LTAVQPIGVKGPTSIQLEQVFENCFGTDFNTCLRGGADEPLYKPATNTECAHTIYYREDFFNSALHEIAHWCIAGQRRRQQADYGYWYTNDGRDEAAQRRFESVEVKPQAVEWHLALACGRSFGVSLDNLSGLEQRREAFTQSVAEQAALYLKVGLPVRADKMCEALLSVSAGRRAQADDFWSAP
jgi:elongation factor P hydroxylase